MTASDGAQEPRIPRYDELPVQADAPPGSSWGVFPDERGTLNFATPERIARAAQLVHRGAAFSLNWRVDLPDPPILGRGAVSHHRIRFPHGGYDDYYDNFYPQASSQWDTLAHVMHPERQTYYNGHTDEEIQDPEHPVLGIDQWPSIAGRFVLLDVARHFADTEPVDPSVSRGFAPADLEAVAAAQGTTIEPGDILLIRYGWIAWYESLDAAGREAIAGGVFFPAPGLVQLEETAAWLWDHRISAVASDVPALEQSPFDPFRTDEFLHARLIPLLGYAVGEMFALEELARDCAEDGVYEGLLVSAPVNMPGGAGSPANAIALK